MCHIVPPRVWPELYAVMVRPLRGGEKGEGSGWCGCEYLRGWMREKYRAMSSGVGDSRRRSCAAVAAAWAKAKTDSESEACGIVVAAAAVDE